MADVEFELNENGVRELLKSPEMMAICKSYADNAMAMLGDGYEVSTYSGQTRVNAEIAAVSRDAREENSASNSILKALRG